MKQPNLIRCIGILMVAGSILVLRSSTIYKQLVAVELRVKGREDYPARSRLEMKTICRDQKWEECSLLVITRNEQTLARVDMEGNWIPMASRDEIADALAAVGFPHSTDDPSGPIAGLLK